MILSIHGFIEFAVQNPALVGSLGWVFLFAWLLFELRSERGRIYQLDKKITSSIIVIRALARIDEDIDEKKVDDYLVSNGMEPGDFIEGPSSTKVEEDVVPTENLIKESDNNPNNDERTAKQH